jgi:hypothetical protein
MVTPDGFFCLYYHRLTITYARKIEIIPTTFALVQFSSTPSLMRYFCNSDIVILIQYFKQ